MRSFLALVLLASVAASASAQLPAGPYTLPQTCTGPECTRLATAIPAVRTATSVSVAVPSSFMPVAVPDATRVDAHRQYHTAVLVPRISAPGERVISIAFPFLQRIGVRRIDVVLGLPTPFGQRIRRFR